MIVPQHAKRLLIIDDSDDLQILLRRVFESKGYEVISALNGKEALDIIFSSHVLPDLILLDLSLPDMPGTEFAKIKEQNLKIKNIPLVLMTASAMDTAEIKNLNIKAYLAKPLDLNDLLLTISRILN